MSNSYNTKAPVYMNFLASENGQIQQEELSRVILKHLPVHPEAAILDAACGPGWLTKKLSEKYPSVQGSDISEEFIKLAKKEYRGIEFRVADLAASLPYPAETFDSVVCNMALPDVENLDAAFQNMFEIIKPAGSLLVTVPNPYYTFPVGVWKRGILGFLLRQKPKLVLKNSVSSGQKVTREFESQTIDSYFHAFSDYITKARTAGFTLTHMEELRSSTDSKTFNLRYQLYRYPLLLLLEFGKPG